MSLNLLQTGLSLYLPLNKKKILDFFSKNLIPFGNLKDSLHCQHMSEKRGVSKNTIIVMHPVYYNPSTFDRESETEIAINRGDF